MSGQQHAPAALYPRERPGTHFTGSWVGPRAGLDGRKISSSPGFDLGPSSPLYRLSYRTHDCIMCKLILRSYELTMLTAFSKTRRNVSVLFPIKYPKKIPLFFTVQSDWVHVTLTVFVSRVQTFKWPAQRLSHAQADCRHLNPDAKRLI